MSNDLNKQDVDQLNSFLRGEISAVETYDQALEKCDNSLAQDVLRENRSSHSSRVEVLRGAVQQLGGQASEGSGAWGTLAKAVAGGAKLFGESAAVAALEEGEDHGLADYKRDYDDLSPAAKHVVATKLLPQQQRSHDAMARLKKIMD